MEGEDSRKDPSESRSDSLKKLSSLRILPIDALLHPSAATTLSTSSRRGAMYCVCASRLYSVCVKACTNHKEQKRTETTSCLQPELAGKDMEERQQQAYAQIQSCRNFPDTLGPDKCSQGVLASLTLTRV